MNTKQLPNLPDITFFAMYPRIWAVTVAPFFSPFNLPERRMR